MTQVTCNISDESLARSLDKASVISGSGGWTWNWINTAPGSLTYVRPKITLGARIMEVCGQIAHDHEGAQVTCPHTDDMDPQELTCQCYGCELYLCPTCYDAFIDELTPRNAALTN